MLESIARGARVASFIGVGLLAAGSAYAADPIKLGVLLFNIAVVIYLMLRLRKQGYWPFRGSLAR